MEVSICVGTFGAPIWPKLAQERAIPSAEAQDCPVIHRHRKTLARARNAALAEVKTEWVVFLDADDWLSPGYIEAMSKGTADLRTPAVSYVKGGRPRSPRVLRVAGHTHACTAECISSGEGNWLIIGTAAPTALLREVGGWRGWPVFEDFDLWMRATLAGATVEAIPEAVYTAQWHRDSRNRLPEQTFKEQIHREIVAANLGEEVLAA